MRKVLLTIFVLWVFSSIANGVTIYKWMDKDGRMNFTDDYTKIPPQYRDQVKTEEREESPSQKAGTPISPVAPAEKKESVKVDRHGLGEDYWRNKVLPWKKQLKEATENYERVNARISERLQEQSGRLMSPTQWNMNRAEMKTLTEERSGYEAQMREAREMLEKIAKEAEEAKANPDWVK
jgi:hypothetical protein